MKTQAKKLFKEIGVLSAAFLQRKFKLSFEGAVKMLEEVSLKRTKRTYSGDFLIKIVK